MRRGKLPTSGATADFARVARMALSQAPGILRRWLPDGRLYGKEYVACNPCRIDQRPGSFRINIESGRWADFATGDAGGDLVSLAAYLYGLTQVDACRRMAQMLGVR